jgi:hypothetical protein
MAILTKKVREIPFGSLKVRDLSKRRSSKTEVVLDGDREVLRLTKVVSGS